MLTGLAPSAAGAQCAALCRAVLQVSAMTNLVEAFQQNNIREFEKILKTNRRALWLEGPVACPVPLSCVVSAPVRTGACALAGCRQACRDAGKLPPHPTPTHPRDMHTHHTCPCRRTIMDDPFISQYIQDLLNNIRTQVGGQGCERRGGAEGRSLVHLQWRVLPCGAASHAWSHSALAPLGSSSSARRSGARHAAPCVHASPRCPRCARLPTFWPRAPVRARRAGGAQGDPALHAGAHPLHRAAAQHPAARRGAPAHQPHPGQARGRPHRPGGASGVRVWTRGLLLGAGRRLEAGTV